MTPRGAGAERTRAVLAIGSNLGDRFGHLRAAVRALAGHVAAVSDVYETPPWGDADQPSYLNAAVLVEADRSARAWLERAHELEGSAGRQRDPTRPFGPRTLDVDVIAVWTDGGGGWTAVTDDDPELTLPHPRAHLRAFVLRPMLDLDPDIELPGYGRAAELVLNEPVATDLAGVARRPEMNLRAAATIL